MFPIDRARRSLGFLVHEQEIRYGDLYATVVNHVSSAEWAVPSKVSVQLHPSWGEP